MNNSALERIGSGPGEVITQTVQSRKLSNPQNAVVTSSQNGINLNAGLSSSNAQTTQQAAKIYSEKKDRRQGSNDRSSLPWATNPTLPLNVTSGSSNVTANPSSSVQ